MKQVTLDELLDNQTVLLPSIIAEAVVERLRHEGDSTDYSEFVNSCEARTLHLFNNNRKFRTMLKANNRDQLYVFMEHWFKSYLLNRVEHVTRHLHGGFGK